MTVQTFARSAVRAASAGRACARAVRPDDDLWDAIGAAHRLGATPDTLDGGFEYNGYHRFEQRPRDRRPGKSWWWVRDVRFVVAFSVPQGYVARQRFPVGRWLPRTPSDIYLSERDQP